MALILDTHVHAALARRHARGRDTTMFLRVKAIPARGGFPHMIAIDWTPRRWPRGPLFERCIGDAVVVMDRRLARYTQWRDVTLSAWRWGPLERLVVVNELPVLLEMEEWERSHPALAHPPAA